MVQVFYPKGVDKIWHVGKNGNRYRLDSLNRVVRLKEVFSKNPKFHMNIVNETDDSILKLAHSETLLRAYKTGKPLEIANSSGVMWQEGFYNWIIDTAWCHIKAGLESLSKGVSVALADGGHHAEHNSGYGFSPINSLVIASEYLLRDGLIKKVAIVDFDVHYANGTHSLVKKNKNIFSADIWRYKLEKWSYTDNQPSVYHERVENADGYLAALPRVFGKIKSFNPDIVFLYLGLDVLESDRMGGIKGFDHRILMRRSKAFADFVYKNHFPVVISIGGGYVNYDKTKREIEEQWELIDKLFVENITEIAQA